MRTIRLMLLLCSCVALTLVAQDLTITTLPQRLSDEANQYAAMGVSANGRYVYGGWSNPVDVSFVYDLETHKTQILEAEEYEGVYISKVLSDGSFIYTYWPRSKCISYLRTAEGRDIPLQSPNPQYGLYPEDASDDGKYIVANVQSLAEKLYQPAIGVRQEDGSYLFTLLPEPKEDLLGLKPQYNKVEGLSPDGKILVGRQSGHTGFEMQYIKWERQEDGSYRYSLPLESFFANLDQPKPGSAPDSRDYLTADPIADSVEYDRQLDLYNIALDEWRQKYLNRLGKWRTSFMHVHNISTPTMLLCSSVQTQLGETPDGQEIWSSRKPIIWDARTDQYKVIETPDEMGDLYAFDRLYDGSILCVTASPGTITWTPYVLNPETLAVQHFCQWLKEHTGTDLTTYYQAQRDPVSDVMSMGIPRISADGKTIVFYTMNTDEAVETEFFNTYIKLSGNVYTANSPRPDAPASLDYYFDGGALVDRSATVAQRSLCLYDTSGSCVYTTETVESRIPLPTTLPKGTYIAQITTEGGAVAILPCIIQ